MAHDVVHNDDKENIFQLIIIKTLPENFLFQAEPIMLVEKCRGPGHKPNGPGHAKTCLMPYANNKALIGLRIRAV